MRGGHLRMSGAVALEHGVNIGMGQFGRVAFAAEVDTKNMVEIGMQKGFGKLGGALIGKMTVPTHDALLEVPWAMRTITQ